MRIANNLKGLKNNLIRPPVLFIQATDCHRMHLMIR